ncbi:MAG: hypothetical protein KDD61_09490 [Bdellovibrionales bacterium]|nr:hypothetical protein [Bdellovibrionales bacterium]
MKSLITITALTFVGMAHAAPQKALRMEFYRGSVQQNVEVEYNSPELKKRSYETKCQATVGLRITDKSLELVNGHYNCQDGYVSDPNFRLAIKEGKLYFLDRTGRLPKDAQPVGQVTENGFQIALQKSQKVATGEVKMDEQGCPSREVERVESELVETLSYSFVKTEKGYAMERVETREALVPVAKRYDQCQIKFVREMVESQKTSTVVGELQK